MNRPFFINGYKVTLATPYPKMQLSERVPVTDEFRAEINAWMAAFFGYACPVKQGQVIVSEAARTMIVHPLDYQSIKASYDH